MMLKPDNNSKGVSNGSESITFRFQKSILDDLRDEAEHKLKSINTLVNQIIKLYITWHKPAKNAGYGYFDKVLVSDIISLLSDEQIIKVAEQNCKHRFKDIAWMLNLDGSFLSYLEGTFSWLEASGFNYKYNKNGDYKSLVLQFDMGRKWSLYFKTYMQQVLEHYKITESYCEMTDNTVIIKIKN
ncbi:MAG: hypothetical protein ACTHKJ_05850 [Candidatus Nitrosocosmicus sp.]